LFSGEEKEFAMRGGANVLGEEFGRRIMYKRRKMEWERICHKGKRRGGETLP
jgi:hypothetical protein